MTDEAPGSPRPGPVFDSEMRALMQADPAAACRLAGVAVDGEVRALPGTFPMQTRTVDLLLRVGDGRLAHFEYERRVEKGLVVRMLGYRYAVMDQYPDDELTQYGIVLGSGTVRGHDDLGGRHFALDLHVVYLRELDPAVLLGDPGLAPLAALGRGTTTEREEALAVALRVIRRSGSDRADELIGSALLLATITLDATIIGKIMDETKVDLEFEAKVEQMYRSLSVVQRIAREAANEKAGEAREQARQELLLLMLRDRFGDQPNLPAVARRLSVWPDQAAAVHAVLSAAALGDLRFDAA